MNPSILMVDICLFCIMLLATIRGKKLAIQIDFNKAWSDMKYHTSLPLVSFGPYSPAYLIAADENINCDVRQYMYNSEYKKYCEKILTVSASGDHPLFCKMYGAKEITTFDITYTSKIIMDIKTLAIKQLDFGEYWQLLKDLWRNPNIISVPNFEHIMQKLDSNEQKYIRVIGGKFALFTYGASPDFFSTDTDKRNQKLLHEELHQADLPAFPFIWSDIAHLDTKLGDNTYDFIYLSNILDWVSDDTTTSVLNALTKRLNYGGRILIRVIHGDTTSLRDICKSIEKQSPNLAFINHWTHMILVKCTRTI